MNGPLAEPDLVRALRRPAALLVVDMQNDYCLPEGIIGSLGFDVSGSPALAERLNRFLGETRSGIGIRIFARTVIPPWLRSPALVEQYSRSPLAREILPHLSDWYGVSPGPEDIVVQKHRYSAFVGTNLDAILRAKGVETVVVTGVTTEVCVESTVRDAFMRDYAVIVVSDCTQATTPERQTHSLGVMDTFFARVHTGNEIIAALSGEVGR